MRFIKITIIKSSRPDKDNLNQELQYLGQSLGLFSDRDKDKSCFRIFIVLVKSLKTNIKLTSDDIADQTHLSRGTVIHHLNRLMEAGIVINQKNYYMLGVDNMQELVELVKQNLIKTTDALKATAKAIDNKLEL
jgi:predicted transcriptional regulator